jgi:hypothetical protein
LLKALLKRAALAAVEGEHGGSWADAAERLRNDVLRDAGGSSLREMLRTKVLKSPPQRAASAGVAAMTTAATIAKRSLSMPFP